MYKPPQSSHTKNPCEIAPPNISPSGSLSLENYPQITMNVKQSTNGKFASNYKASPIDLELQISLRRKALEKGL